LKLDSQWAFTVRIDYIDRDITALSHDAALMSNSMTNRPFLLLFGTVALMWGLEVADIFLRGSLDGFGIRPREVSALSGILFAPFLHGGLRHLISNTLPFLVLGGLILLEDWTEWLLVSLFVAFASGLGTWLFGAPNTVHIGASGVVFGYFGFLLARAYFERSLGSLAIALFVVAMFGSMIWGILPVRVGISWEGHLFGLLGGMAAAKLVTSAKLATGSD
jgi:membrane associated rhomboid family serine protease